ncbi:EamA family transporter [bacterium]|nr:EamA family transporter [bacterium]
MQHSSKPLKSTLLLVVLTMIWGLTFPTTRSAVADTHPLHFLTFRFLIAAVLMTPFMVLRHRRQQRQKKVDPVSVGAERGTPKAPQNLQQEDIRSGMYVTAEQPSSHPPPPAHAVPPTGFPQDVTLKSTFHSIRDLSWVRGAWVGLFLLAGFVLQVYGLKYTTASRSGFFTGMLVPMTPVLALLFRTSRVPWFTWFGIVPAILGTYLMAQPETGGMNLGDWLTLGCAFAFSMQMVMLEASGGAEYDTWSLVFAQIWTVTLGAGLAALLIDLPFVMTTAGWWALLYTSLFGTIIAVAIQTRFQPDVPAGHAAIIFALEPVFAAIFAWLLLRETWTLTGLLGASLILLAMFLSGWGSTRPKRAE